MRPFIVRRAVSPSGDVLFERQPVAVGRAVSAQTARLTTELLRRVVEEQGGTGGKARLDDFPVAGKTGTAQKVDRRTGAYSSKRIGSFVGFVPADRPRVVILVLIDEPGTSSYGGVVAAPVFRAIATGVLKALGVQPAAPAAPPVVEAASDPTTPASSAPLVAATPSFLGLSLREAFARARATGWDVRASGTGWVAAQKPEPGAPLPAERRLSLELRQERLASAAP
jgi:cell division protein FtsI (penicillin-binding protein 3)